MGAGNPGELFDHSPADVAPEFQPDGRRSADVAHEAIKLAMRNGSHRFEWLMKRLDGRVTRVDVVATTLTDGGRTLILKSPRNIEQSKRVEEDLRA